MDSVIQFDAPVAAAGNTGNIVIAVPAQEFDCQLAFTAEYTVQSATSGMSFVVQGSRDNGATFIPIGVTTQVVNAAGGVGSANRKTSTIIVPLQQASQSAAQFAGELTNIQVVGTNLDATNAANVTVESQMDKFINN